MTGCARVTTTTDGRAERIAPTGPAKAVRQDLVGYDVFNGELYVPPTSDAIVHPPYNAPLEQVYVTVGKKVSKGEVLMKLTMPEVDANYSQATDAVSQAERAYADAKSTYYGPVKDAQAQLDKARSVERQWRLATDPSGDASMLNQATEARQQAEAALRDAESAYKSNMQSYQQQLDAARASKKDAKADAKQAEIKSPITGTVVKLSVTSGQQVGQSRDETLAEVVNLKELKVRASLSPEEFSRLKEKSPVVITFADFPDKPFDGWVVSLRTVPGTDGVHHEAMIGFRNDDGVVKPGAQVQSVGIETGRVKGAIVVPLRAVDRDTQDRPVVQVLEGENWKPHVVKTGLSDGRVIQIVSGVSEGDTVKVTEGDRLR